MVQINLDSKYAITSDPRQWILLNDGRPFWFFSSLEELLHSYLDLKARDSPAKLIHSLIDTQNKQQERLHSLLTTLDFKAKLPILARGGRD